MCYPSSKPFFSVVIPTYNRAHTISRAVESALEQSFRDIEIFVVDDGSVDNTEVVVRGFRENNVMYKKCDHFGGPARARNVGIKSANSDWICFLDSDDWWYPEKLEKVYRVIGEGAADFIYHPMDIIKMPTSKQIGITPVEALAEPVGRSILLNSYRSFIPNSSVVVRKRLLEDIDYISEDRDLIAVEDFDTWTRLAEATERFQLIRQRLGGYVMGTQNLTRYDLTRVAGLHKIVTARMRKDSWPGSEADRRKILAFIEYQYGRVHQYSGRFDEAGDHYRTSLRRYGPISVQIRAALGIISSKLRVRI
jgi:glycosyltransferase involved in cell wall biosynthesis